jgi:hypothetical protein
MIQQITAKIRLVRVLFPLRTNSPTVSEARKKLERESQELPEQSEYEKIVDSTAKI